MLVGCAGHLVFACNKKRNETKFSTFTDDCINDEYDRQRGCKFICFNAETEPRRDQEGANEEAQPHPSTGNHHDRKGFVLKEFFEHSDFRVKGGQPYFQPSGRFLRISMSLNSVAGRGPTDLAHVAM